LALDGPASAIADAHDKAAATREAWLPGKEQQEQANKLEGRIKG